MDKGLYPYRLPNKNKKCGSNPLDVLILYASQNKVVWTMLIPPVAGSEQKRFFGAIWAGKPTIEEAYKKAKGKR